MKKQVSDFIKSLGGQTHYSGKTRTMHISAANWQEISEKVIEKFGYNLPFKLS